MSNSYFELIDEAPDKSGTTSRFAATEHSVGPWSEQLQHGGPPSALAVTAAERAARHGSGRDDLAARRVTRSAALAEVSVTSGDRVALAARVWFVRKTNTSEPVPVSDGARPAPAPDAPTAPWAPGCRRSS